MIKRILPVAILGAALIGNIGCSNSNGDFKKYMGISYKVIRHGTGKTAAVGDYIEYQMVAKVDTMVLADTRKQPAMPPVPVQEPKMSGILFPNVFTKLAAGDSALVEVSCDTLMKVNPTQPNMQLPPWLKKGKKISITISVLSIKSKEEVDNEKKANQAKQMAIDDQKLQDYFAKNNIKAEKTASGLYYTVQSPGSGPQITAGQTVSMMYTGKTLDGKIFDTNRDTSFKHTQPLTFPVGAHRMIAGVDEGAALLKKNSKATLYLPSTLGYGENAPPNIGPNAVLIFEVEITDVKAASEHKSMPGGEQPQSPQ